MKSTKATSKPGHQTVTKARLAPHAPGEVLFAGRPADVRRNSFDKLAEGYASTLREHLRTRGFEFKADLVTPLKNGCTPDPKTETAETFAGDALRLFWHAREALAGGQAERAACYALMGGVAAGQALKLFYEDQDSRYGRKVRAEKQRTKRGAIMAKVRGVFDDWTWRRPSAKELHDSPKLEGCGLPPFKTFQRWLTLANWDSWPNPGRETQKVPH